MLTGQVDRIWQITHENFPYFLSATAEVHCMASILFGGAVTLSLVSRAIRAQTRVQLSTKPTVLFFLVAR